MRFTEGFWGNQDPGCCLGCRPIFCLLVKGPRSRVFIQIPSEIEISFIDDRSLDRTVDTPAGIT